MSTETASTQLPTRYASRKHIERLFGTRFRAYPAVRVLLPVLLATFVAIVLGITVTVTAIQITGSFAVSVGCAILPDSTTCHVAKQAGL